MVGDAKIIETELAGLAGHLVERVLAVAGGGVAVERSAQLGPLDEARDFFLLGGLDLAEVFAQLGRDVLQAERGEEFLLGAALDQFALVILGFLFLGRDEQAPFAELFALRDGALAHGDVCSLLPVKWCSA